VYIKKTAEQQKAHPTNRKPYSPPSLKEFGTVGLLTQAGSGLSSETMGNGMGMASMSPNQRA